MANKNNSKKFLIISLSVTTLFIIALVIVLILSYYRKSSQPNIKSVSYDSTLVDSSLSLDENNALKLTKDNQVLVLSSSDKHNTEIGPLTQEYLFADRGSSNNDIIFTFSLTEGTANNIKFTVTICDVNGDNQVALKENELEALSSSSSKYSSNEYIYIKSVLVEYTL